ncbi:SIS domain-containing protein [Mailhella massiliensis]|uniref:Phosphoheptose isomerase n=1 Tax=Mailhella massiliensis TaxID=1903261 RepID=A0A921AW59_9BACT|nr:D-sedoheptulose 7-phosphate isomerase [Mailhella massiliensis]HJD97015.1 D-sedoheptulose 7-phosphate isomerase [Mailhella massiliensis]
MKTALEIIREHAEEGAKLRCVFLAECAPVLDEAARRMAGSIAGGGKILVCGNGGSAADAQHMTGELLGRFLMERPSLPAVALNVDTSTLTAVGNDYGYEEVFARQVRGLGRPGDVLVAFSTSGGSPNVVKAIDAARERGMTVVGLTGKGGGRMASMCDYLLNVPHDHTPLIQEMHEACMHLLCQLIDHYLFENVQALDEGPKGA